MKLLKPKIGNVKPKVSPYSTKNDRTTGDALQKQRWQAWKKNPHCQCCGMLVSWPKGFELDHIIPLESGGKDVPENRQVLCVWWDMGVKMGCHADKTAFEQRERNESA